MCINVACCADVTVTEPLLNLLQAHAIGIEQTGTTMAQIVKADTLHLVCDQKIREMLTQKVGPNPLSNRVYMRYREIPASSAAVCRKGGIDYNVPRHEYLYKLCTIP